MMEWCSTSTARKHVALRAMCGMMVLYAWCVVVVGVIVMVTTTVATTVSIPTTKAREEHSQCDQQQVNYTLTIKNLLLV